MASSNSQIAVDYMRTAYPCISSWLDFVKIVIPNAMSYDAISCAQIAMISNATMKTLDYITQTERNSSIVPVARMLFNLHDSAWSCWTSFTALSRSTSGTSSIVLTPTVLQGISTFNDWDSALNPNPTVFNPPSLLDTILQGVTI